ncbi:3241_t:CDS:10 [Dentiscutata erythropus]|uniref:3241_t:CDS:1 n=1 Tax=Dentiscutata erythropus TaxID=1348616 RepID=A0A9N9CN01_9GLOM|nr:3241_t:CDS:10 [Dentiscutata erythropus]
MSMSNGSSARSSTPTHEAKPASNFSDTRLNDLMPSFHLENLKNTVPNTLSTTASILFSPLTPRAVKGDAVTIITEFAPQMMERRVQQYINTRQTESSNQLSFPTDELLVTTDIPESKAPLSLIQGYRATFSETESINNRKRGKHKRKVKGFLSAPSDGVSDSDNEYKPLNQLIADRDRVVKENDRLRLHELRMITDIKRIEKEIAELTTKKLGLESNLTNFGIRKAELTDQLEDLNEKIANFCQEDNNGQNMRIRKGKTTLRSQEPGTCIKTLEGHDDMILCLDFNKSNGTLASASLDNTLKLWDLANYQCLGILDGHKGIVNCMRMDRNHLITGSRDCTIRQWDISKVSPPTKVKHVSEIKFNQNTTSNENGLSFVGDDCWLATLEGHTGSVTCLHYENGCLVSGSSDKTMKQWDMETGQCILTMDILWAMSSSKAELRQVGFFSGEYALEYGDFVGALQFRDVGLASGTEDVRTGQAHRTLLGHTGPITCLQFDDLHVVSGSIDKSIKIWDLRTGSVIDTFTYDYGVISLQFDPHKIVCSAGTNDIKSFVSAVQNRGAHAISTVHKI